MKQTLKSGTRAVILTLCALGLAYGAVNSALGAAKVYHREDINATQKQRGSACWFSALCFWVPCRDRSLTSALISAVKSRLYAAQGENPAISRLCFWPRSSSAGKCDRRAQSGAYTKCMQGLFKKSDFPYLPLKSKNCLFLFPFTLDIIKNAFSYPLKAAFEYPLWHTF